MGRAHTVVLERAATIAGGYYGGLLLRERRWLEQRAAGRFNDGVLKDWYYKKTPQAIWCVRRLTQAVRDAPPADEARVAFLLHCASPYFVDALWMCHVAQRYMVDASAAEKKQFDNGIEREVEEIVDGPAFQAPEPDGRGYWTLFWQGRLESDRRSRPLLEAYHRGAGYLDIALESVPYCIGAFAAYLTSLERRRSAPAPGGQGASDASAAAHPANTWVVALHAALETRRPAQECLASETVPPQPGWQTDAWLDASGARFGTGEPRLDAWPGEWVLAQDLSGSQLAERVFTPEFAATLAEIRGYVSAEVEQEPEKAAPHAIADRDRQLAAMAAWHARWDRAVGNPGAVPVGA